MEVINPNDAGAESVLPAVRKNRAPKVATPAPLTPMDMIAMAVQRGSSVEELGKLWEIAEKVRKQQAEQAFVTAMTRFKQNAPTIEKTRKAKVDSRKGPDAGFAYKYANLADVCNAVIKALADVGISHDWTQTKKGTQVIVTCTITHELGHSKSTELEAGLDDTGGKNNLQALGSTISYLERYSLLGVCGLAVDDEQDDDGASAGQLGAHPAAAPVSQLLFNARASAAQGRDAFALFWKDCTPGQRGELRNDIPDLEQRVANVEAAKKGGK